LSYAKNPDTGSAEVLDRNDYYPFGMNSIGGFYSVYDVTGTPLNNKYNGKELQETGFYDYGWRQYMPDLGRWFGMDQLSETYSSTSPYAYVGNNPAMNFDPDGRVTNDWLMGFWYGSGSGSTTWTNTGDGFTSNRTYENGMTGHFSYGGEFTMSNMIQEVVIQARGNSNTWNSAVNYAFNSLSLYAGIDRAAMGWNMQQARSRLHEAMGDSPIDDVQGMLDGVGTIPLFGEIADGTSGVISLLRGNRGQAALSFGAMIPIVGWGATAVKLGKTEAKATYYSVAYEMKLADDLYPGKSSYLHFKSANTSLAETMAADAKFAESMAELGINIPRSSAGSILGKSPTNWVWHHDIGSGMMQLVPKSQHTIGSFYWGIMHPGGKGGMSIWGGGY